MKFRIKLCASIEFNSCLAEYNNIYSIEVVHCSIGNKLFLEMGFMYYVSLFGCVTEIITTLVDFIIAIDDQAVS